MAHRFTYFTLNLRRCCHNYTRKTFIFCLLKVFHLDLVGFASFAHTKASKLYMFMFMPMSCFFLFFYLSFLLRRYKNRPAKHIVCVDYKTIFVRLIYI